MKCRHNFGPNKEPAKVNPKSCFVLCFPKSIPYNCENWKEQVETQVYLTVFYLSFGCQEAYNPDKDYCQQIKLFHSKETDD